MDPVRWERVSAVFAEVMDAPHGERCAMLDTACAGDPSLRAEVEALLARDGTAGEFLAPPPPEAALGALGASHEASPAGRRIGAYTIRSVLGRGGSSVVYEAEQDSPRRTVALKVLRALPVIDEVTLRLFQREVQALARLDHPGIGAIHEAGCTDEGWHYFAMEKVDGEPITRHARRQELATRERLDLFQRVCEAVHYAHQRGVIHRDLKPSNILVTAAGAPRVLDFGLARINEPEQPGALVTQTGMLQGTLAYMSPEQAGGSAELDVRSDVYSLGVVLYELLTDRLPYRVGEVPLPEAVRTIRECAPPSVGSVQRELRGDVETIVAKAMAKDADQRYASAAGLGEDIERFLSGQPILAHPPSTMYQVRKLVARHRVPASLLAMLLVVIIASAVATGWLAIRFADQRDRARTAEQTASTERESATEFAAFLESILEHANPGAESLREPSLRQVLDDGFARIDAIDNRLVRARVMTTMGRVYDRLDQADRACGLLGSAAAIRREDLGPDHPDTIDTLGALAKAQRQLGKHDEADATAAEIVRSTRSLHGPDHPLLADAWTLRGAGRFYAGDHAGAAAHFGEALAIRRRIHRTAAPELAEAIADLGLALTNLNRLDEAEPLLRESVAIRKEIGDDELSMTSMEALAQMMWKRDRRESERIYAEEVSLARTAYHANHPRLGWILTNYAYTVDVNSGPSAAEPLFRESVSIYRAAYGDSPTRDVAWAIDMLAGNLSRQNRRDEARPLLVESLDIRIKVLGPDHAWTRNARTKLENFDLEAAVEKQRIEDKPPGQ